MIVNTSVFQSNFKSACFPISDNVYNDFFSFDTERWLPWIWVFVMAAVYS